MVPTFQCSIREWETPASGDQAIIDPEFPDDGASKFDLKSRKAGPFARRDQAILFSGITVMLAVQSFLQKDSDFLATQIKFIAPAIPAHMRGVSRSSRTLARDAVDARARLTMRAFRGRRSGVVLMPRRWRQVGGGNSAGDGDNKARSPGRAPRKPLKPLRAGMPGETGEPRGDYAHMLLLFCI
jgi:hypothetical protein